MSSTEPQPGLAYFSSEHYQLHNHARLQHLARLGLEVGTRVLELGSGPGDHSGFYLQRGCRVVSIDSRSECLEELKKRFPQVEVHCIDLNQPERLHELGVFDWIHCYGILYHLEFPERAIAAMAGVGTTLVLETCVSPGNDQLINHVSENAGDYTQSSTGRGCRPTRAWVFDTLKRYFEFVYQTKTQPDHPEFPTDWTAIPADHGLIRFVTVASHRALDNPLLSAVLLDHQRRM